MNAQDVALWSCCRRRVKGMKIEKLQKVVRLIVSLECGHEIVQDVKAHANPISGFTSTRRAQERVERLERSIKAAGFAPCVACGPAPDPSRLIDPVEG